jgi:hypothetical protein
VHSATTPPSAYRARARVLYAHDAPLARPTLQALSSKCPNLIHHGSAGVIGIIIGLARGWQMALVVCATLPLMGARQRPAAALRQRSVAWAFL